MQNELRKKQNSAVYDEEKAINKRVVDKMFSQLDVWREEIPKSRQVSAEDSINIENTITELIALLNEKLTAIDTLIFKKKGVDELYTKIVNNNDFQSKYNNLIKPITQGKKQSLKTAVEAQLQLLLQPLSSVLIGYKTLLRDFNLLKSRLPSIFNAYALYKLVYYQIDVSQFKTINNELINSSKYLAEKDLTVETNNILYTMQEQYNLMPSEREKIFIEDPTLIKPAKATKEEKEIEAFRDYILTTSLQKATAQKQLMERQKKIEEKADNPDFLKIQELNNKIAIVNELLASRKQTSKLIRTQMPITPLPSVPPVPVGLPTQGELKKLIPTKRDYGTF
jgi:hypothetical protein